MDEFCDSQLPAAERMPLERVLGVLILASKTRFFAGGDGIFEKGVPCEWELGNRCWFWPRPGWLALRLWSRRARRGRTRRRRTWRRRSHAAATAFKSGPRRTKSGPEQPGAEWSGQRSTTAATAPAAADNTAFERERRSAAATADNTAVGSGRQSAATAAAASDNPGVAVTEQAAVRTNAAPLRFGGEPK